MASPIISKIYDLIGKKKSPVFLEVGMHKGEDTDLIRSILDEPIYWGFEPDPRNIEFIRKNNIDQKINFVNKALSCTKGTADFYLSDSDDNWCGSSSLKEPRKHLNNFPHIRFEYRTKVETTTLDDIYRHQIWPKIIDFIWLDTQGAELDIIKGGHTTLANTRFLYLEYYNEEIYEGQPSLENIFKELSGKWSVLETYPNDILLKNNSF